MVVLSDVDDQHIVLGEQRDELVQGLESLVDRLAELLEPVAEVLDLSDELIAASADSLVTANAWQDGTVASGIAQVRTSRRADW